MGHVSPAMMKTYSHIRRQALDEAAAVLEPSFAFSPTEQKEPDVAPHDTAESVTSQATSQIDGLDEELQKIAKEFGSSGWARAKHDERSESCDA